MTDPILVLMVGLRFHQEKELGGGETKTRKVRIIHKSKPIRGTVLRIRFISIWIRIRFRWLRIRIRMRILAESWQKIKVSKFLSFFLERKILWISFVYQKAP